MTVMKYTKFMSCADVKSHGSQFLIMTTKREGTYYVLCRWQLLMLRYIAIVVGA